MATMKKRAKVRLEFPEKLFYEKLLSDWKASMPPNSHSHTVKKALENLRLFPLNVCGYSELRKIKGIGENIATRLDAAWTHACTNFFLADAVGNGGPTLEQVRQVKKGEALQFLETAFVSKGKRDGVPFLPRPQAAANEAGNKEGRDEVLEKRAERIHYNEEEEGDDMRRALLLSLKNVRTEESSLPTRDEPPLSSVVPEVSSISMANSTSDTLTYDPKNFSKCRLLLIVDGREHREAGRQSRKKNIAEHLTKLEVDHEMRALSVGDYLWVLRLENGRDEMVLDYVVERKTWDDLKSSIRQTRYTEQKQRLKESGIRNVIMVAEGTPTSDHSLEQALITTNVDNRFLIHRTTNLQGTAKFLKTITTRLEKRCKSEHICGRSFAALQDESRKTKTLTIADVWMKQLTVCPMMSIEKAQLISSRFPTMRSMAEFYQSNREDSHQSVDPTILLHQKIPQIPKALSAQLSLFFD